MGGRTNARCLHGVYTDYTPCQVCDPERFVAEAHLHDPVCKPAVSVSGGAAQAVQEIHQILGRGEGHTSLRATVSCIVDGIASLKEQVEELTNYELWYHELNDAVHAAVPRMDPVPKDAVAAVQALIEDRDFWDKKAGTEHARANALEKVLTAKIAELAIQQARVTELEALSTSCHGEGGYWRTDAAGLRWDPCFGCADHQQTQGPTNDAWKLWRDALVTTETRLEQTEKELATLRAGKRP